MNIASYPYKGKNMSDNIPAIFNLLYSQQGVKAKEWRAKEKSGDSLLI